MVSHGRGEGYPYLIPAVAIGESGRRRLVEGLIGAGGGPQWWAGGRNPKPGGWDSRPPVSILSVRKFFDFSNVRFDRKNAYMFERQL